MIVPVLKDDALLADIASASEDRTVFHLWWLGQSGFLLKWRKSTVLFDPYLSDSLTTKYADTDKPHVRMTERCIAPERLAFVNFVTSSHAHTDHADADTLVPMAQARELPLPVIMPTSTILQSLDRWSPGVFSRFGLDAGLSVPLRGFTFTGIPAAHDTVERDARGECRFLGFIVQFGPWTIYHSGDTRWHEELPTILAPYRPDVMLVPINGHDPARRVAGNLDGAEAAALAKVCGASMAIPHHFEMFEFNTASPDLFIRECERLQQPYRVLRCGERWTCNAVPRSQQSGASAPDAEMASESGS